MLPTCHNFLPHAPCRFALLRYDEKFPILSGVFRRWTMKVRSSVRRICEKCKLIKRKGVVRVICEDPRHKQRQG